MDFTATTSVALGRIYETRAVRTKNVTENLINTYSNVKFTRQTQGTCDVWITRKVFP